jgi:hypothetical protein
MYCDVFVQPSKRKQLLQAVNTISEEDSSSGIFAHAEVVDQISEIFGRG